MQKKIYFIFTFLISLFINCFCSAFEPMIIHPCDHEGKNKNYIVQTFDENDEQLLDSQNLCDECTINFMKENLKDYIGTPYLVKYCEFYHCFSDGEEKINIHDKLEGYICADKQCKCGDCVIYIDDGLYRIFNLKWGFNYLPRILCLHRGHEKKIFEVKPIN